MTKQPDQAYYNRYMGAWALPYRWQKKIRKDNFYEIVTETRPVIYGVILEASQTTGCFRVLSYSTWCPDGEKGIICIVDPTRMLTRQEFEYARTQHWKVEEEIMEVNTQ